MEEKLRSLFRSWWRKIKKRPYTTGSVIFLIVLLFIFLAYIIGWDWTGFIPYSIIVTTNATKTTLPTSITVTLPYKTLYDWLQLLIIPAVLAVAGYVINLTISRGEQAATEQRAKSEQEATNKRAETERQIALDNQREIALQEYIDKMSNLLFNEHLRESKPGDGVRKVARALTLTILARLDGCRKSSVIRFLYESELLFYDFDNETTNIESIIKLNDADLSGADLNFFILYKANLGGTNLVGANLREANLSSTYLGGVNLSHANLHQANLTNADFAYSVQIVSPKEKMSPLVIGFTIVREADLSNANLGEAYLGDVDFSGSNLENAFLTKVNLERAFLKDVNLKGANLEQAILGEQVDFTGASLERANLKDAKGITTEELEKQAKSLTGATMPDGSIHQ